MNVWVKLPEPLDAAEMAARAEREGVSFLPGRHFAVSTSPTYRPHTHELRLSFAGLDPQADSRRSGCTGRNFSK